MSTETAQETGAQKMRWYTVHVYSSMEKSVQRSIIERIGRSELKDLFGEVLLPIEKVEEARNGRKIETERRMYPGYVFVEMVMTEETWHLVNSTPRVIEFLGNNHPVPLSDAEIAAIKDRMSVGTEKARPKIMFEPGEIVRIKKAPSRTSMAASKKFFTTRAACAALCRFSAARRASNSPSTKSKRSDFPTGRVDFKEICTFQIFLA